MGLILYLSGDSFQSSRTLYALQYWSNLFSLDVSLETLLRVNFVLRKGAHFGEFFVLGVLAFRAFGGNLSEFDFRLAAGVAIGGALFAVGDELRQSFSGWRTASALDAGVDTMGVLASLAWLYWRRRFASRRPLRTAVESLEVEWEMAAKGDVGGARPSRRP